jgi:hypothetical protein
MAIQTIGGGGGWWCRKGVSVEEVICGVDVQTMKCRWQYGVWERLFVVSMCRR